MTLISGINKTNSKNFLFVAFSLLSQFTKYVHVYNFLMFFFLSISLLNVWCVFIMSTKFTSDESV